ncbi:hypothetical protein ACTJJ7_00075 [Phyllobacterium sp. 22229]|uniref:hypothetical protein n=1 Tax=Phyllobacterium TaxID=28100 RepID=UPI000D992C64|nr:hypothetical protein [Phyllobacterium myrsinacearum]PWV97007.1 hypothetical protein DEV92_101999 [Phyllobacterium myrsinacearum]RZS89015.1 hypothetical protein EV217_1413 [Phyllobacterium myrsinacearum]RZV09000.1 hypothetical protein EV654_0086 [Phyllobacterium myrsinacearum]
MTKHKSSLPPSTGETGTGQYFDRNESVKVRWPFGIEVIRIHIPRDCHYKVKLAPTDENEYNVDVITSRALTRAEKDCIATAYYETTPFVLESDITFVAAQRGFTNGVPDEEWTTNSGPSF